MSTKSYGNSLKHTSNMGTVLLTKFNHEEYWTEEYEKFNTLPRDKKTPTYLMWVLEITQTL